MECFTPWSLLKPASALNRLRSNQRGIRFRHSGPPFPHYLETTNVVGEEVENPCRIRYRFRCVCQLRRATSVQCPTQPSLRP